FAHEFGNAFFAKMSYGGMIVRMYVTSEVDKFYRNPNQHIDHLTSKFKSDLSLQPPQPLNMSSENDQIAWHIKYTGVVGGHESQDLTDFNLARWLVSLYGNPQFLTGKTVSLPTLIKDPFLKAQISKAIWAHSSKRYLSQLAELIRFLQQVEHNHWR